RLREVEQLAGAAAVATNDASKGSGSRDRNVAGVWLPRAPSAAKRAAARLTEKESARWPDRSSKPRCPRSSGMEGSTPSLLRHSRRPRGCGATRSLSLVSVTDDDDASLTSSVQVVVSP